MRLHEVIVLPGILKAMKRMLDGHDSFAIQDIYDNMDDHGLHDVDEVKIFRKLLPDIVAWFERCVRARADGDTMQHLEYITHLIDDLGISELKPEAYRVLEANKEHMLRGLLNMVRDMELTYVSEVITDLRQIGIRWPELATIESSMQAEIKK